MITPQSTLEQIDTELAGRGLFISHIRRFPRGFIVELRSVEKGRVYEGTYRSTIADAINAAVDATENLRAPDNLEPKPVRRFDMPRKHYQCDDTLVHGGVQTHSACNAVRGTGHRYTKEPSEVECMRCLSALKYMPNLKTSINRTRFGL